MDMNEKLESLVRTTTDRLWHCGYNTPMEEITAIIQEYLKEAQRLQMEEDCRLICLDCADERPLDERHPNCKDYYHSIMNDHDDDYPTFCEANSIRQAFEDRDKS